MLSVSRGADKVVADKAGLVLQTTVQLCRYSEANVAGRLKSPVGTKLKCCRQGKLNELRLSDLGCKSGVADMLSQTLQIQLAYCCMHSWSTVFVYMAGPVLPAELVK